MGPARILFSKYVLLPCYQWNRRISAAVIHCAGRTADAADLARYPIVTYVFSFMQVHRCTRRLPCGTHCQCCAGRTRCRLIKTYVRLGWESGIVGTLR